MTYLEKLLEGMELEWSTLGATCEIKTGKGITKKDSSVSALYPIISGGKEPMGYFKNFNRDGNTVTISRVGANAGFVCFLKNKFYLNDKCFSVLPNKDYKSKIDNKFLFYILKTKETSIIELQSEGGVPTINTSKVSSIAIPIPTLEIQQKIVAILDKFTELSAEITTELRARKKQYAFYREKLLNFRESKVEWKTMGAIGNNKLTYGSGASAIEFDGKTRYIRITDITENGNLTNIPMSPSVFEEKYILKDGDILLARSGATVGKNFYYSENMGKSIYAGYLIRLQVDRKIAYPRYIYYYLNSSDYNQFIANTKSDGSQPNINAQQYSSLKIPIPSLEEQARIVAILDKFDTLTTSISEGLPKEIELRKKQYEFYRDMLLSFPK
jgi:type I restriction enzyme S subunit